MVGLGFSTLSFFTSKTKLHNSCKLGEVNSIGYPQLTENVEFAHMSYWKSEI